jgi:hypothetical protein
MVFSIEHDPIERSQLSTRFEDGTQPSDVAKARRSQHQDVHALSDREDEILLLAHTVGYMLLARQYAGRTIVGEPKDLPGPQSYGGYWMPH